MTIATPETPAPPLVPLMTRLSPLSIAGMMLLAVLWGLSIPITKLGLDTMPPMTFTALRFAFAVPFLFVFAIGRHRIPLSALPKVAALG
nr:EamA family transporter [Mesorhizobium sp. Root157]